MLKLLKQIYADLKPTGVFTNVHYLAQYITK